MGNGEWGSENEHMRHPTLLTRIAARRDSCEKVQPVLPCYFPAGVAAKRSLKKLAIMR